MVQFLGLLCKESDTLMLPRLYQMPRSRESGGLLKILSNLSDVDCKNSSLYSAHTHSRPGKRLPWATNRHETHLPLLKTPKITPKFSLAGSIREGFTKKMSCFVQGNLDKIQKNSYFFFVKPSLSWLILKNFVSEWFIRREKYKK